MSLSIVLLGGTVYATGVVWTYGYTIGGCGGKEEIFRDEKLFIFCKAVLWPVLILFRFLSMPWKALFDYAYRHGCLAADKRNALLEEKMRIRAELAAVEAEVKSCLTETLPTSKSTVFTRQLTAINTVLQQLEIESKLKAREDEERERERERERLGSDSYL
jgi:signal transduction histidine kinase